ncbi:AraC family transcriptional regulator [Desulfocurvibacter africanus]|uniref:AraC family transcriptional regulator n=1 Tax=Desulfocurvibacter africanus TaxID=873 RepID=UPI002FDB73B3
MSESAEFNRLPILGGVEWLRATYVTQTFSRHTHEGYALGVIERGALRFRYRGETLRADAGSINLVIPGEAHDGQADGEQGWSYSMFYLPPEALLEVAGDLAPRPSLPHFRSGVLHDPDLAQDILLAHATVAQAGAPALAGETLVRRMLTAWVERHADGFWRWPRLGDERGAVRRVRQLIHERYREDLHLAELAETARLSPFHLLRVFERETGLTPHVYLVQVRVQSARELLAGPLPLAQVAAETGFADQSHLTRAFKRQYGLTPGRYRKIVQDSPAAAK